MVQKRRLFLCHYHVIAQSVGNIPAVRGYKNTRERAVSSKFGQRIAGAHRSRQHGQKARTIIKWIRTKRSERNYRCHLQHRSDDAQWTHDRPLDYCEALARLFKPPMRLMISRFVKNKIHIEIQRMCPCYLIHSEREREITASANHSLK